VLLVLVLLLLFGHPVRAAASAAAALAAVGVRGLPLVMLVVLQLAVTGVGVAAGIAISGRRPGAPRLAQAALVLSAGVDLLVYLTPFAPNNRAPGDTPFYVAGSLIYHGAWILYLQFSTRVRRAFEQHDTPPDGGRFGSGARTV
jgi:hypothetical protein